MHIDKNSISKTSKLAIACCSAAIISVCYFPLAIVPIVLGHLSLANLKKHPKLSGNDITLVGMYAGYGLLIGSILLHVFAMFFLSGITVNKYIVE